jgi:hypothetical protein
MLPATGRGSATSPTVMRFLRMTTTSRRTAILPVSVILGRRGASQKRNGSYHGNVSESGNSAPAPIADIALSRVSVRGSLPIRFTYHHAAKCQRARHPPNLGSRRANTHSVAHPICTPSISVHSIGMKDMIFRYLDIL